ncbi:MAG: hypothetical protein QOK43_3169 [Acidimicrobiaceae bacterium]|nr:hypothetical protein [Acidimicrobiaceae bacterium]
MPPPAAPAAWIPSDLPLPPGTFTVQDFTPQGSPSGTYQAILAVPNRLADFVRYVAAQWHDAGWAQGRGEAEQGEAENTYSRLAAAGGGSGRQGGAWRAREAYCDKGTVELLLILKK